jgi:hypothetical protein
MNNLRAIYEIRSEICAVWPVTLQLRLSVCGSFLRWLTQSAKSSVLISYNVSLSIAQYIATKINSSVLDKLYFRLVVTEEVSKMKHCCSLSISSSICGLKN